MIYHYISLSLKHLKKNPLALFVNIAGLSLGIISCTLIYLFIQSHIGYDSFHQNSESIYRVVREDVTAYNKSFESGTPYPLSAAIRNDIPEIANASLVFKDAEQLISFEDIKFKVEDILFIEPEFFDIFKVDWLVGNKKQFSIPNKAAITKDLAIKLFGTEEAIGKSFKYINRYEFVVVGLIEKAKEKSLFQYSMLVSLESLDVEMFGFDFRTWSSTLSHFHTFVRIPEDKNTSLVSEKLNRLNLKYAGEVIANKQHYDLQALNEIHFDNRYTNFGDDNVISKKFLWIFASIGLIILLLACINFVNLSLANMLEHKKEIAILKSISAKRNQIINQVFIETGIVIIIAVLIAIVFLNYFSAIFYQKVGLTKVHSLFDTFNDWFYLIGLAVSLILVSGIYPAITISNQNPIDVILGNRRSRNFFQNYTRNALLVFQFTASMILIVCTLVISKQMRFIKNSELGFDKQGILSIQIPDGYENEYTTLKSKLLRNPNIKSSTFCLGAPLTEGNFQTGYRLVDSVSDVAPLINLKPVDENYLETFDLKLIAGNWMRDKATPDSNSHFVLNKFAIEKLGIRNPYEIIGRQLRVSAMTGEIVGVVDNFHSSSMHNKIEPVVFIYMPRFFTEVHVKMKIGFSEEIINFLSDLWQDMYPDVLFEYEFYDEAILENYESEKSILNLIQAFTLVSILIASLGLLGIVSQVLLNRTKEIGIRKVNGAKAWEIIQYLNFDLLKRVLISIVIAIPIAWFIMQKWLENFAFRIELSWWIFALGGSIVMSIALATISLQTWRAARRNPIESLRYE